MKRLLVVLSALLAACGGSTAVSTTRPITEPPAVVTPEPEPAFEVGTGIITFGTAYDEDSLEIPKPLTRFKATFPEIAWSASFWREPGTTTITLVLVRQSSGGAETTLINQEQSLGSPDYVILANSADLAFLADNKPGTYVMRYIESGDTLAEGSFELVK